MRVLMITGDKGFKPGLERYELQKQAVEELVVVYVGHGGVWPKVPSGRFDVVTTQDPFWRGLYGLWVAKRLKVKLNVQVHADLSAQSFIKHILAKVVLRHATSVRVVSQKIREQVQNFGVKTPVTVLPVFVDLSRFKNLPRTPSTQKTVLWVGRFEPEKDPLLALKVFKEVRGQVDARMIMLGKGSLESTLRAAGAGLFIEFPGWQDPVPYLQKADVVLSTSREESWGASIVEALAAGVPVVAPDVGIAREAGATVVPRQDLAEATIKALQSNARGTLKLHLPSKEEWAKAWRASLV